MTEREHKVVDCYFAIRSLCHDGPFYTGPRTHIEGALESKRVYSQEQRRAQYKVKSPATIDPFTAIESYSDSLRPKERELPDLRNFPFNKSFFPEELHATLDGGKNRAGTIKTIGAKKMLNLPTSGPRNPLADLQERTRNGENEGKKKLMNVLDQMDENTEEIPDLELDLLADEENGMFDDDEPDDMYEEEEDDAGDDYNAQGYFEAENNDDDDDDGGDYDGGVY